MWQGLEGRAERVAEQKRSFCGAMEAEAATLESPVLAGALCGPAKSHPDFENEAVWMEFLILLLSSCPGKRFGSACETNARRFPLW